jgi:hypothetical protein
VIFENIGKRLSADASVSQVGDRSEPEAKTPYATFAVTPHEEPLELLRYTVGAISGGDSRAHSFLWFQQAYSK